MTVADWASILLGLATGFAATCWSILGWSSWRARQWGGAIAYGQLVIVNLVSATIIILRLARRGVVLPPGLGTLLVLPLIVIPAYLSLRSWLRARAITVRNHD